MAAALVPSGPSFRGGIASRSSAASRALPVLLGAAWGRRGGRLHVPPLLLGRRGTAARVGDGAEESVGETEGKNAGGSDAVGGGAAPEAPGGAAEDAAADVGPPEFDFRARHKERVMDEIISAGKRRGHEEEALVRGLRQLKSIFIEFEPVFGDGMGEGDWADMAAGVEEVFQRVITLKHHFPRLDATQVLVARPKTFLQPLEELERNVALVKSVLRDAEDVDNIVQVLPEVLDPAICISCLVTIQRWFPKKDPVEQLNLDPDMIRRAQREDIPLDPVFFDGESFSAPMFDRSSDNLNQPWQKYIRHEGKSLILNP
mmetsp:Transcript_20814/g.65890  ORF Transcript_20814/g.65890 Transcript_20814/m.65890 type:complete len:316 (-) Transcript_20814:30-977(-)